MDYILWFLKLRLSILRNILWKDRNTVLRTVKIGMIIVSLQILLIYLFKKYTFNGLIPEDITAAKTVIMALCTVATTFIHFFAFVQSISNIIKNFYKSPDLNYLISIPVPINYVFMSKYAEYVFNSNKDKIFIMFPLLAAMGWSVSAPWFFYLLIIPFYFLISLIPSTLGLIIGMLSIRILSTKLFTRITIFLSFAVNILFIVILSGRTRVISPIYVQNFTEFLGRPFMTDIIPVTAGIRILSFSATGELERLFVPLISLVITTLLAVILVFFLSQKLFYGGWSKSQHSDSKVYKKQSSKSGDFKKSYSHSTWGLIKGEWQMALRNHEMFIPGASLLLVFVIPLILFVFKGYFSEDPLLALYILIGIAGIFNIMAVSVPFNPIEIAVDKNLMKNRFWLLKVMPLNGYKVFDIESIMVLIPGYLVSLVGILLFSVIRGIDLPAILLSGLALLMILYGSAAIYTAVDILFLEKYYEKNRFTGYVLSLVLPALYGMLSAGPMILFFLKDAPIHIWMLSKISNVLTLPAATAVLVATVIVTILLSRKITAVLWEKLEI